MRRSLPLSIRLAPALCALLAASGCLLDRAGRDPGDAEVPGPDAAREDAGPRDAGPPPVGCGDGVRGGAEECDGADLGGATCASRGLPAGSLVCNTSCMFDTSGCRAPRCGDGIKDADEACDGADLGTASCGTLGLGGTALACTEACALDPSGCVGCGNGRLDSTEECDGAAVVDGRCAGASCGACALDEATCTFASAGDGRDGDRIVSGTLDVGDLGARAWAVTALGVDTVVLAEAPAGLAAGDRVLLYSAQGAAADCAPVGRYELAGVASVSDQTVSLTGPVVGRYGAGDANADLSGQRVVLLRVPQLDELVVQAGASLEVGAWDGSRGGVIALAARRLVVESGGQITASGRGFRGGSGWSSDGRRDGRQGESICGHPHATSPAPNLGGGGGGKHDDPGDGCGQGGGGGGHGTAGTSEGWGPDCVGAGVGAPAMNAGGIVGAAELMAPLLGSGGGAGATDDNSNSSGTGGRGGGLVLLLAGELVLEGAVRASGADGTVAPDTNDAGNGGGGAGGSILVRAGLLSGAGRLEARGGDGPARVTGWNSAGGDGGVGRIRVDLYRFAGELFGTAAATAGVMALGDPAPGHTALLRD